jgi:hypothetical protein
MTERTFSALAFEECRHRTGTVRIKTFQVIRSSIVFELQPEIEGGYTITVPALPGCISYGETFEKAMEGWLAVARIVASWQG